MVKILSGLKVYQSIKLKVNKEIQALKVKRIVPTLAIVSFQARGDSQGYLKTREKLAAELGVKLEVINYKKTPKESDLIKQIKKLSNNNKIHGIIIDRPLPKGLNEYSVFNALDPYKDIDGCHPLNSGKIMQGYDGFTPNTSAAVMALIEHYKIDLNGIDAVVVGRSKNVGLPMFPLLTQKNATVTICHSKTKQLEQKTKKAQLLIVAVGKPDFITNRHINPKTTLIDIGTNYLSDGKVIGDTSPLVYKKLKAYTPVPGGIGPITNIILFENLVKAIKMSHDK